jgi:hypothetical protein
MTDMREKVARAACRAHYGLGETKLCKAHEDAQWLKWLPVADAMIKEAWPLFVEDAAKVAEGRERPREDICCQSVYADIAAAIRNMKAPL